MQAPAIWYPARAVMLTVARSPGAAVVAAAARALCVTVGLPLEVGVLVPRTPLSASRVEIRISSFLEGDMLLYYQLVRDFSGESRVKMQLKRRGNSTTMSQNLGQRGVHILKSLMLNLEPLLLPEFGNFSCNLENLTYHRLELKRAGAAVNKRVEPLLIFLGNDWGVVGWMS